MKKWIALIIVAAISISAYFYFSGQESLEAEIAYAKKGDVEQIVSVTGTVEADPEIDLRFQTAGKLEKVFVKVGDQVQISDVLAELENTDEKIKVQEAQANLSLARANLQLKIAGASNEDIAVSKAALDSAKTSKEAAEKDLENTKIKVDEDIRKSEISLLDAEKTLESRVQSLATAEASFESTKETYQQNFNNSLINSRITAEQSLITIQTSLTEADNILGINNTDFNDDFEDYLGAINSITRINAENSYKEAKISFDLLKIYFEEIKDKETEEQLVTDLLNRVNKTNILAQKALGDTFTMLEFTLTSTPFTPTVLAEKKSLIDTAKKNLIISGSNLENARQNIISAQLSITNQINTQQAALESARLNKENAENNLSIARNDLIQANLKKKSEIDSAENILLLREAEYGQALAAYNLKIAGVRSVEIAGLQAQVQQAEANLSLAESQLAKTQLRSPAVGVIANIYFEEGENIITSDVMIRMISSQKRITANVSEVDITKIHLEDEVSVNLDALPPEQVFSASITEIDPAETEIQGVIYYQIKSVFKEDLPEIKPGMTANIDILADKKTDVLVIPTRAIKYSDSGKYVEVPGKENSIVKVEVSTGLEGDLYTEILSGLKEGDAVITYGNNGS